MAITVVAIGETNPVQERGGAESLMVNDSSANEFLREVVLELRKMNVYNEIKTDAHIKESDLDKE